jgi:putative membrane protein
VAHVAVTANTIDIEMGRLAASRSHRKEVQEFAAAMIRDHAAVNARAGALAGKLKVTPEDNAVSQSLQAGATAARTRIEALTGEAFDRAYVAREVEYHQGVLNALDGVLIPTTENPELRQLLVEVRGAILGHLAHAKHVQEGLPRGQ